MHKNGVPGLRLVGALALAFLLCSAGGVYSGQEGGASGDQPVILIEQMHHDLGEVFEAKSYKHTFTVKNTGKADLHIKKVSPG